MNLAKVKQELYEAQNAIRQVGETKRNVLCALASEQDRGMEVRRYHIYRAYLDGLDKALVDLEEQRLEIARRVSERHDMVEAERIKKETLEYLREDRRNTYVRTLERTEQKEADELIGLRFHNPRVLG